MQVVLIKCDSYDIDDRVLTRKILLQMNHIFEKAKHGKNILFVYRSYTLGRMWLHLFCLLKTQQLLKRSHPIMNSNSIFS